MGRGHRAGRGAAWLAAALGATGLALLVFPGITAPRSPASAHAHVAGTTKHAHVAGTTKHVHGPEVRRHAHVAGATKKHAHVAEVEGPAHVAAPAQVLAAAHAKTDTVSRQAPVLQEVWSRRLTDGPHGEVALGSPSLATLTGGPAVVFGDRSGHVYALNLATGDPVPGWPKDVGVPVTSTPSVLVRPDTAHDTVIVGTGDAAEPCAGGYDWLLPTGAQDLVRGPNPPTDHACGASGVFAGIAVGTIGGVPGAVAGTLGQETYAFDATTRTTLPGFPWFQADTDFATPALADVEGDGANQIIGGGAQTAGLAYGRKYTQGGHIQILTATGSLVCTDTTDESVNSSPAVGRFLAGSAIGIVAGTGPTFPTASQHDQVIAVDTSCQQVWETTLPGTTGYESPALADVLGNGQLQVLVTTRSGGVYALDGANGSTIWHAQLAHDVYGSPVTVELGTGHQDVVVGTINGFDVLTGQNGDVLVSTVNENIGFQNAPLVTKDANGTIGITIVGYQPDDSWAVHYEIATSDGDAVDAPGTWPQFHHDPQLTGNADAPIVTVFTDYTRISGSTPDATAAAELEHQFVPAGGHCPGTTSTRPVLLATDKTYADALAGAPLARSLGTGTLLTAPTGLSPPAAAALAREGITRVTVVGGPLAVSTTVVRELEATPARTCGGAGKTGSDITVTRIAGATAYETAAQIAAAAASGGVGSLDLAGAYGGVNATGGDGRFNVTAGAASRAPGSGGALATAVLATGAGFQDAEAASTLAYAELLPVLLTAPTSLSPAAGTAISSLHVAQVIVMGGPLAVSNAVVSELENMGVSVVRVAGQDAAETAVELAKLETSPTGMGAGWRGTGGLTVAQGDYFSDGLAGAVVAADGPTASGPEPLVLTESPTTVGAPLAAFLRAVGTKGLGGTVVTRLTVLGGPLAIPSETLKEMGSDL